MDERRPSRPNGNRPAGSRPSGQSNIERARADARRRANGESVGSRPSSANRRTGTSRPASRTGARPNQARTAASRNSARPNGARPNGNRPTRRPVSRNTKTINIAGRSIDINTELVKEVAILAGLVIAVILVLSLFIKGIKNKNVHGKAPEAKIAANIGSSGQYEALSFSFPSEEELALSAPDGERDEVIAAGNVLDGDDIVPDCFRKINNGVVDAYFDKAVFIGDSRTEGLLYYSGIANMNAFAYKGLNVGVLDSSAVITVPGKGSGFTTYQAIDNTEYDYYYIMFGVNELGWLNFDIFIDDMNALIDKIYAKNPNAVVYVMSVLPVSAMKSSSNDVFTMDNVNKMNGLIQDMCKSRNDVIYLDLSAAVEDANGFLPVVASADGIHCNPEFNVKLGQYIRYNVYVRK